MSGNVKSRGNQRGDEDEAASSFVTSSFSSRNVAGYYHSNVYFLFYLQRLSLVSGTLGRHPRARGKQRLLCLLLPPGLFVLTCLPAQNTKESHKKKVKGKRFTANWERVTEGEMEDEELLCVLWCLGVARKRGEMTSLSIVEGKRQEVNSELRTNGWARNVKWRVTVCVVMSWRG